MLESSEGRAQVGNFCLEPLVLFLELILVFLHLSQVVELRPEYADYACQYKDSQYYP